MSKPPKPHTVCGDLANLPSALAPLIVEPHWVVWRWEVNDDGKWTKVPYQPGTPRYKASVSNPKHWGSYTEALAVYKSKNFDGIGYMVKESRVGALDLDKCRNPETGELLPGARDLIERADSYVEVTPSGTGLRIIGIADGDEEIHKKLSVPGTEMQVEVWRRAPRYFTVTGAALDEAAEQLAILDDLLDDVVAELEGAGAQNDGRVEEADLPANLLKVIRNGADAAGQKGKDKTPSAGFFGVVAKLKRLGWSADDVTNLLEKYPNGIGARYIEGRRLHKEVTRAWNKAEGPEKTTKKRPPSQADRLAGLGKDEIEEFFIGADDREPYATIRVAGHLEHWRVRSVGFRYWLIQRFYEETGSAPNKDSIAASLNVFEAQARAGKLVHPVFVRVGKSADGALYLDLCNDNWQAVETTATGWRVVDNPPVRFRRDANTLTLPAPERGGNIDLLRHHFPATDDGFVLMASSMLMQFRPDGPFPVQVGTGEAGTGKTTRIKKQRMLIDPHKSAVRAAPHNVRDVVIAAGKQHLLVYDNLSFLPDQMSDLFCMIATGGGYATRTLFENDEETVFNAVKPIALCGINNVAVRGDLADRVVFIEFAFIPEEDRKDEKEVWAEFEADRAKLLGVLLDGVAHGLRNLPTTKLNRKPRMADFALWATACETAFWPAGTFMAAYERNRAEANEHVIESNPVADVLIQFMADKTEWKGTATKLLQDLTIKADDFSSTSVVRLKQWPRTGDVLTKNLKKVAPQLRGIGIEWVDKKSSGNRRLEVRNVRLAERKATVAEVREASQGSKVAKLPARGSGFKRF
jgi:hypothetical protein